MEWISFVKPQTEMNSMMRSSVWQKSFLPKVICLWHFSQWSVCLSLPSILQGFFYFTEIFSNARQTKFLCPWYSSLWSELLLLGWFLLLDFHKTSQKWSAWQVAVHSIKMFSSLGYFFKWQINKMVKLVKSLSLIGHIIYFHYRLISDDLSDWSLLLQ